MKNNTYIPLDLAIRLKDRGFMEPTYAYRVISNDDLCLFTEAREWYAYYNNDPDDVNAIVSTPTYAETFRWLLKTHHVHIEFSPRSWDYVDGVHIIKWSFWANILDIWQFSICIDKYRSSDDPYDTIEEAEYNAILGALELVDKLPSIREKI